MKQNRSYALLEGKKKSAADLLLFQMQQGGSNRSKCPAPTHFKLSQDSTPSSVLTNRNKWPASQPNSKSLCCKTVFQPRCYNMIKLKRTATTDMATQMASKCPQRHKWKRWVRMAGRQCGSTNPATTTHYQKMDEQVHSRCGAKVVTKLTIDQEEESSRFIGHRSGNQCFTSARRTIQQDPTWRLRAKARGLSSELVSECLSSVTVKLRAFDKSSPKLWCNSCHPSIAINTLATLHDTQTKALPITDSTDSKHHSTLQLASTLIYVQNAYGNTFLTPTLKKPHKNNLFRSTNAL